MSRSSSSPCAACKFLRRKCTQECVFAPYFPPDNPQRFACVHKVFGASNVAKLLNELHAAQREDAVKSLAYEAEARLRDPVYGCVGHISVLQHKLRDIQMEINNAKKELSTYIGPQAFQDIPGPTLQQYSNNPFPGSMYSNMPPATAAVLGGQLVIPEGQPPQQHQFMEGQQLAGAMDEREQQEMFRNYEHQQQEMFRNHEHQQQEMFRNHEHQQQEMFRNYEHQQQEMFRNYEHQQQQEFPRFSGVFDVGSASSAGGFSGQVYPAAPSADPLSPSLALGSFDNAYHMQQPQQGEPHHHPHHIPLETQLLLPPPQKQPQQQSQQPQLPLLPENEEYRSVGPFC